MITVEEALALIKENTGCLNRSELIRVENSSGKILSEDIIAPISLPSFRQSAMDGYALRFHDKDIYAVIGEVKAGDSINFEMRPGQAVRIFTGASVPDAAEAVVIQERTVREKDLLKIERVPNLNDNIRSEGEQILKGSRPLKKGHYVTPSGIGLLLSMGIQNVAVNCLPKISVVVTGNELVRPGDDLPDGKIYESNSAVIQTALEQRGIQPIMIAFAKDTLEETEQVLKKALDASDIVLISGGISVGDYDFVGTALENLSVDEVFYKVLQKPGKPLFFGRKKDTFVFALPGNPASTLTCFYVYVHLLIDILTGADRKGLLRIRLPLADPVENKFGRALFLKASIRGDQVNILDFQNSSTMISFAQANALAYVPERITSLEKGDLVETIVLPYGSSN
jgi:molybdopterin molybdotransferase